MQHFIDFTAFIAAFAASLYLAAVTIKTAIAAEVYLACSVAAVAREEGNERAQRMAKGLLAGGRFGYLLAVYGLGFVKVLLATPRMMRYEGFFGYFDYYTTEDKERITQEFVAVLRGE